MKNMPDMTFDIFQHIWCHIVHIVHIIICIICKIFTYHDNFAYYFTYWSILFCIFCIFYAIFSLLCILCIFSLSDPASAFVHVCEAHTAHICIDVSVCVCMNNIHDTSHTHVRRIQRSAYYICTMWMWHAHTYICPYLTVSICILAHRSCIKYKCACVLWTFSRNTCIYIHICTMHICMYVTVLFCSIDTDVHVHIFMYFNATYMLHIAQIAARLLRVCCAVADYLDWNSSIPRHCLPALPSRLWITASAKAPVQSWALRHACCSLQTCSNRAATQNVQRQYAATASSNCAANKLKFI